MIRPQQISQYDSFPAEKYGGKAAGIARLTELLGESVVPATWVIPCEYTFNRGQVDLKHIVRHWAGSVDGFKDYGYNKTITFAVRSGAPVSMPGLLQTKLDVDIDDIQAAVEHVWSSWDTPHAVAYREQNNIPHDMGTAVNIMLMVSSFQSDKSAPYHSGVAFTSDPDQPWNKMFNPMVEIVDGSGEALVGGSNSGVKVTKDSHEFSDLLWKYLYTIHDKFGPSDVEFVAYKRYSHSSYRIAFVQHRPMKFSKVDDAQIPSGAVLVTGQSVGSKVRVKAAVTTDANDARGKIIMMNDFTPENYIPMLQSVGIITEHGGSTCHAAIVAREMGKPCISGVYNKDLASFPYVVLDGFDGAIRMPKADDEFHEVQVLQDVTRKLFPERKPDFSITQSVPNRPYDANLLICRLYDSVEKHANGVMTLEERDRRVGEIAKVLCTYLYQSVVCETRHTRAQASTQRGTRLRQGYCLGLKKLGVTIPQYKRDTQNRDSYLKDFVHEPEDVRHALKVVRLCHKIFLSLRWVSSYGGKKWSSISQLLIDYLEGRLSDLFFCDSVFNLQHNSGTVFGKFNWMTITDSHALKAQLDGKRTGTASDVVSALSQWTRTHRQAVKYLDWESIFKGPERRVPSADTTREQDIEYMLQLLAEEDGGYVYVRDGVTLPLGYVAVDYRPPIEGEYFLSIPYGHTAEKAYNNFDVARLILAKKPGYVETAPTTPQISTTWAKAVALCKQLAGENPFVYYPDAPLPEGWMPTGEFRPPNKGEHFLNAPNGKRVLEAETDWSYGDRMILVPFKEETAQSAVNSLEAAYDRWPDARDLYSDDGYVSLDESYSVADFRKPLDGDRWLSKYGDICNSLFDLDKGSVDLRRFILVKRTESAPLTFEQALEKYPQALKAYETWDAYKKGKLKMPAGFSVIGCRPPQKGDWYLNPSCNDAVKSSGGFGNGECAYYFILRTTDAAAAA